MVSFLSDLPCSDSKKRIFQIGTDPPRQINRNELKVTSHHVQVKVFQGKQLTLLKYELFLCKNPGLLNHQNEQLYVDEKHFII